MAGDTTFFFVVPPVHLKGRHSYTPEYFGSGPLSHQKLYAPVCGVGHREGGPFLSYLETWWCSLRMHSIRTESGGEQRYAQD